MSHADDTDRPATFREVLAVGEFRALYLASALSWFGDYAARAAVTALVFQRTENVTATAATFAISYLPWLGLGPVLAALAERLPYRRTMVVSDLLRMALIALVAVPQMPVWGVIALLFLTSVCNPPFDAARSALLPKVLDGDRYVVGLTLQTSSFQVAQIVGYLSGAALSTVNPHAALLFNSVTFGLSAWLIAARVGERPSAMTADDRSGLLRETAGGFTLVWHSPVLRAVAAVVFGTSLLSVVPEGLAAAWAADLSADPTARGWIQGMIMIANPVGFILGGLVVGRVLAPSVRQKVIPAFAVLVPLSLVPALSDPGATVVYLMSFLGGVATAGLLPATNALFVRALPDAYRARAFGVMRSGILVLHGLAVFVTGWLSERFSLPVVVGLWGVLGIGLMVASVLTWPRNAEIAAEVDRVARLNAGTAATADDGYRGRRRAAESPPAPVPQARCAEPVSPPGTMEG